MKDFYSRTQTRWVFRQWLFEREAGPQGECRSLRCKSPEPSEQINAAPPRQERLLTYIYLSAANRLSLKTLYMWSEWKHGAVLLAAGRLTFRATTSDWRQETGHWGVLTFQNRQVRLVVLTLRWHWGMFVKIYGCFCPPDLTLIDGSRFNVFCWIKQPGGLKMNYSVSGKSFKHLEPSQQTAFNSSDIIQQHL